MTSADDAQFCLESASSSRRGPPQPPSGTALHTEASHRFERGVDIDAVPRRSTAPRRCIAELAEGTVLAGRSGRVSQARCAAQGHAAVSAGRRASWAWTVPRGGSRRILEALGFGIEDAAGERDRFVCPAAGVDVEREEDLIEEMARIRGYDAIPVDAAHELARAWRPSRSSCEVERRICAARCRRRASTRSSTTASSPVCWPQHRSERWGGADAIDPLKNPLSVEQSAMRTTLLRRAACRTVRSTCDTRSTRCGSTRWGGPTDRTRRAAARRHGPAPKELLRLAACSQGRARRGGVERRGRARSTSTTRRARSSGCSGAGHPALTLRASGRAPVLHPRASAAGASGRAQVGYGRRASPAGGRGVGRAARRVRVRAGRRRPLVEWSELVPKSRALPTFPGGLAGPGAGACDAEVAAEDVREVVLREVGGAWSRTLALFDVYTGSAPPAGERTWPSPSATGRRPDAHGRGGRRRPRADCGRGADRAGGEPAGVNCPSAGDS